MDWLNSITLQIADGLRTLFSDSISSPLFILFIAVVLGVMAVPKIVGTRKPVHRRLAPTVGKTEADPSAPSLRPVESSALWNQLLLGLEKRASPAKAKQRTTISTRLVQAGYIGPQAARGYFASRVLLAVGLPVGFLFLAPLFSRDMPVENILFSSAAFAIAGLYLPSAWVSLRIKDRQRAIQESFPDALDMLMVCVEAGLGLDSAFSRVGEQMALSHPVLAEQFAMVSLELRAGKSREAAMRNLSDRIGLPDITSFVVLLIQTDQLGTSVAATLRVQAEEMRVKRMLQAEEKANMLTVKMSVVLILFLLPSMFVAILSPAVIRISRQLIPILSGTS